MAEAIPNKPEDGDPSADGGTAKAAGQSGFKPGFRQGQSSLDGLFSFFASTGSGDHAGDHPRTSEALANTIDPDEVKALIRYISRRGWTQADTDIQAAHEALSQRALAEDEAVFADANLALVQSYTRLTAYSAPYNVDGRTILDSEAGPITKTKTLWLAGFFFLMGALAIEMIGVWLGKALSPGPTTTTTIYELQTIHSTALVYILPFFWGGLGSFVYLIKTLSDRAALYQFSRDRLQGTAPRLVLGAIFGGVVANLFGDQVTEVVNGLSITVANLSTNAIAFLAGLGVKAVFGAFQKIIDLVHGWIQSQGAAPSQPNGPRGLPPAVPPSQPPASAGEAAAASAAATSDAEAPVLGADRAPVAGPGGV